MLINGHLIFLVHASYLNSLWQPLPCYYISQMMLSQYLKIWLCFFKKLDVIKIIIIKKFALRLISLKFKRLCKARHSSSLNLLISFLPIAFWTLRELRRTLGILTIFNPFNLPSPPNWIYNYFLSPTAFGDSCFFLMCSMALWKTGWRLHLVSWSISLAVNILLFMWKWCFLFLTKFRKDIFVHSYLCVLNWIEIKPCRIQKYLSW